MPLLLCVIIVLAQILIIKKLFFLVLLVFVVGSVFLFLIAKKQGLIFGGVFFLAGGYFWNAWASDILQFNRIVTHEISKFAEIRITGRANSEIRAISSGLYYVDSGINFESKSDLFNVRLVFSENFLWDEFPELCSRKFECILYEDSFSLSLDISDYARSFTQGVVSQIKLYGVKSSLGARFNPSCTCIDDFGSYEISVNSKLNLDKVRVKLLQLYQESKNEKIKLGLAFMLGAILGDGEYLPRWVLDLFKESGLYHLLVVSGYHLGMMLMISRRILGKAIAFAPTILNYLPINRIEHLLGLVFTLLFLYYSQVYLPLWRALISLIIVAFLALLDRRISFIRLTTLTLLSMQIIWPLSILTPGVQLTFAALLGLGYGGVLAKIWERKKLSFQKAANFILPNLLAIVFVAPVQFYWFETFTLMAIFYNLVFGFLFSVVVVGCGLVSIIIFVNNLPFATQIISFNAYLISELVLLIQFFTEF